MWNTAHQKTPFYSPQISSPETPRLGHYGSRVAVSADFWKPGAELEFLNPTLCWFQVRHCLTTSSSWTTKNLQVWALPGTPGLFPIFSPTLSALLRKVKKARTTKKLKTLFTFYLLLTYLNLASSPTVDIVTLIHLLWYHKILCILSKLILKHLTLFLCFGFPLWILTSQTQRPCSFFVSEFFL